MSIKNIRSKNDDQYLVLSLDPGSASCGYALDDVYNQKVLKAGSAIIDNHEIVKSTGGNCNADRRAKRGRARLLNREKVRIRDFNRLWSRANYPAANISNNILLTKNKGLTTPLTYDELYSILLHYLSHRGFSDRICVTEKDANDAFKGQLYENNKLTAIKHPCEIQLERFNRFGKYRGEIKDTASDEIRILSNHFSHASYVAELNTIFEVQRNAGVVDDEFVERYMKIFNRERKFSEGPGDEMNRTDYGIYTTKKDENGNYVTEKTIFDHLVSKCTIYNDEIQASACTYSAQEYLFLNELTVLTVNETKLSPEQKRLVIDKIKSFTASAKEAKKSQAEKVFDIIEDVIGEKIVSVKGYITGYDEKPRFHTFEPYRMLKVFFRDNLNKDFDSYDVNIMDELGETISKYTDIDQVIFALSELNEDMILDLSDDDIRDLAEFVLSSDLKKFVNKRIGFSIKALKKIVPAMNELNLDQESVQHQLGLDKIRLANYLQFDEIPADYITADISNPVVKASAKTAIRVANEIVAQYGVPDVLLVEMPRSKNDPSAKRKIKDAQKENATWNESVYARCEKYGVSRVAVESNKTELRRKLKLWDEQNGIDLYTGRNISEADLIQHAEKYDLDHIIPDSIIGQARPKYDLVLTEKTVNGFKGQRTPHMFMSPTEYAVYKLRVKEWVKYAKKNKAELRIDDDYITKKASFLLYEGSFEEVDNILGFAERSLIDTGYASRIIVNGIKDYFAAHGINIIVESTRGAVTNHLRKKVLKDVTLNGSDLFDKDRDLYGQHAVDAMLMGFGYMNLMRFTDNKTRLIMMDKRKYGKVRQETLDSIEEAFKHIDESNYNDISSAIAKGIDDIQYSFNIDRKSNRLIAKTSIIGVIDIDDVKYTKSKGQSIYTAAGAAEFEKAYDKYIKSLNIVATSMHKELTKKTKGEISFNPERQNAESLKSYYDRLRVYSSSYIEYFKTDYAAKLNETFVATGLLTAIRNKPVFFKLCDIYEQYKNVADKPNGEFAAYRNDTGQNIIIRGTKLDSMYYLDKLGKRYIDVSHKYGQNQTKAIMVGLNKYRTDVYYDTVKKIYVTVAVYYKNLIVKNGKRALNMDDYETELRIIGLIKPEETMNDFNNRYKFVFSLFKNSIIEFPEPFSQDKTVKGKKVTYDLVGRYRFGHKTSNTKDIDYINIRKIEQNELIENLPMWVIPSIRKIVTNRLGDVTYEFDLNHPEKFNKYAFD